MVSQNLFGRYILYILLWVYNMSYMKHISMYCEDDDMEGLVEFLHNHGDNSMRSSINMAAGFMIAHNEMRNKKDDEAYKVLNNIHDKLQEEEE